MARTSPIYLITQGTGAAKRGGCVYADFMDKPFYQMKYLLIIILTVFAFPSIGQEIEKVVFTSQQANEPPTKQGRPKYSIEFKRTASDELATSDFRENKKRKKLNDKVTIDKARFEKVIKWKTSDKKTFSQSELEIDISTLKTGTNTRKLNFEIPADLIVSVDSFQFCQTLKMTKSISTGGKMLTVTLIYKAGLKQEFIFNSGDIGEGNFNLQDYILCYILLTDKIPNDVPGCDFFSKNKFTDILLHYQRTVECEGYYYREFTDRNPNMSSKDKRMMTGWDFIEYMGQRNKKK